MSFEKGLEEFRRLATEIDQGMLLGPTSSEADTRAKVITRVLTRVLNWPEISIDRETKSASGYVDYRLKCPHPVLIIEAKRYGRYFVVPAERNRRSYVLDSLKSERDHLGKAIRQARKYADDEGIEFACITNGVQWVVFRAIARNERWTRGVGIIYRNFQDIEANFTEFWNLLSHEAIAGGSLPAHFASATRDRVSFGRALDSLHYSDNPLQRNHLSAQLHPLIDGLFRDLTAWESDEILRKCYVVDRKVQGVSREVQELFLDTVPSFAKKAGFQDLVETEERSGALYSDFRRAVERGDFGTTVLLLGGIGCGKTTFIHRFFRVTAKTFIDARGVFVYVPFTEAPLESSSFSHFVRRHILEELKQRYPALDLSALDVLRRIYATSLEERRRGTWAALSTDERANREATFLEAAVSQVGHCEAVIRYLRRSGVAVAVVVDNVDQRDPADQVKIFLLAHQFCRDLDAIVLVALREESYFRAEQAGAFNAYHNVRYHIASPDARHLLQKRVEFALDVSRSGGEALRVTLRTGLEFDAEAIRTFLRILNRSAFKQNPAICQFIDAISQGNMRAALDMFNQFMVSGSTNVEKMLDKYSHGGYMVAEHEFIKAVMLGDFQFYKDARSPVTNLFEVSGSPAASNLTGIRLLHFLEALSGHAHPEGTGFVPIEDIVRLFGEVFGETEDVSFIMGRFISRHLLESDNCQITTLDGVRFVRITRSGKYYLNTLVGRFQYLDLVSLDTPIWDRHFVQELRKRAATVDLYERVERTEWLLNYLKLEEERTLATSARNLARRAFSDRLVANIDNSFRQDLARIAAKAHLSRARLTEIRTAIAHEAGTATVAVNG